MNPVKTEDGYKLGAWVRTTRNRHRHIPGFKRKLRRVGHGISDSARHRRTWWRPARGELYTTQIMGIEKEHRKPGLLGDYYDGPGSLDGKINKNTNEGIFGM